MDNNIVSENTKFCKFCGNKIPMDAVICPSCGRQVEVLKTEQPNIVINNNNTNTNTNINKNRSDYVVGGKWCNKWVSFWLCLFLGFFGAHKFYEGKTTTGILYFFTVGLFGIGWIVDIFRILVKPNPYFAAK